MPQKFSPFPFTSTLSHLWPHFPGSCHCPVPSPFAEWAPSFPQPSINEKCGSLFRNDEKFQESESRALSQMCSTVQLAHLSMKPALFICITITQPRKFSFLTSKESVYLLAAWRVLVMALHITGRRRRKKKKPNFLLVYYLSDSEMGYNYGVTFPTANMFQCKQLTPVLLAGLKRLLRDCGKLQCPMNNK